MNIATIRSGLAALALTAVSAALLGGANANSPAKLAAEDICGAAWPAVTTNCIEGRVNRVVRLVGEDIWATGGDVDESLLVASGSRPSLREDVRG